MIGLIETARAEAGRVPLWPLHVRRLTASARALGIPLPPALPTSDDIARAARDIAGIAAVRLTVGWGEVRLDARPAPPVGAGWQACGAQDVRRAGPLRAHKTTARAEHEAARATARARGCEEAVWLDGAGRLTEGTITNLFVATGGRVRTPPAARGTLLPGLARARLLSAGQVGGLLVEEGDLRPEDLAGADEAFLTNAVRGAVPLLAWEGTPLRRGCLWQEATAAIFDQGTAGERP